MDAVRRCECILTVWSLHGSPVHPQDALRSSGSIGRQCLDCWEPARRAARWDRSQPCASRPPRPSHAVMDVLYTHRAKTLLQASKRSRTDGTVLQGLTEPSWPYPGHHPHGAKYATQALGTTPVSSPTAYAAAGSGASAFSRAKRSFESAAEDQGAARERASCTGSHHITMPPWCCVCGHRQPLPRVLARGAEKPGGGGGGKASAAPWRPSSARSTPRAASHAAPVSSIRLCSRADQIGCLRGPPSPR